jgi:hypothetical protein
MRRLRPLSVELVVFVVTLSAGCSGPRASRIPLGGERDRGAEVTPKTPAPAAAAAPVVPDEEAEVEKAEVVDVAETNGSPPASGSSSEPAAPIAFQARPYATGQRWSRSFDLEMQLMVGPDAGVDLRMTSHQEARFEVLRATSGKIDQLQIEYPVYASKIGLGGATPQESPEATAGKRYIVTFTGGKPQVRDASGGTPPKKELDTVNDDGREPSEIAKALGELSQLAVKGTGDFSLSGAIALAGGEDDDTKISRARGSLLRISTATSGARSALIDLSYTLTSDLEDDGILEAEVAGTVLALDAPARYETVTLQGPVSLKSKDPGGMQGRGTLKVTTTYKY